MSVLTPCRNNRRTAVILANLGTPDTPDVAGVRRFIGEFLWDPRVVEIPRPIWWMILNLFILPFRPRKAAQAYQSIWWDEGSPLKVIGDRQVLALQAAYDAVMGQNAPQVFSCVTYGKPLLSELIEDLRGKGYEHFVVLPLYPQYSATTTAPLYDQLGVYQARQRDVADCVVLKEYHIATPYLAALERSVREHWQAHGKGELLLMSFHGIPQACVDRGDPYYQQCLATAQGLAKRLGLAEHEWRMSFQSRLGRAQWLQPYTAETLATLPSEGIKHIDVMCPGFASDCLETLEEMGEENKHIFEEAGGQQYNLIACLNDAPQHIDMMLRLTQPYVNAFVRCQDDCSAKCECICPYNKSL